jgi:hypothetical protein
LVHSDAVSEHLLARTRDLWDQRVRHVSQHPEDAAELGEFYWFIRSRKFSVGWWLPQLASVIALYEQFNPKGMIREDLGLAAREDPAGALEVIVGLVGDPASAEQMSMYDLMEHAVPQVIAAGLDSSEGALRNTATKLMNDVGKVGYIDLAQRVRDHRRD